MTQNDWQPARYVGAKGHAAEWVRGVSGEQRFHVTVRIRLFEPISPAAFTCGGRCVEVHPDDCYLLGLANLGTRYTCEHAFVTD